MLFDPGAVIRKRITEQLGLNRYGLIMKTVNTYDVSTDTDFQKQLNRHYRVRRNTEWQTIYYTLFELMKQTFSFSMVINCLYDKTGNIEASSSSKMLATLDPSRPIWDSNVLSCLKLSLTGTTKDEKLGNAIHLYGSLEKWYDCFLQTDDANHCLTVFDRTIPEYAWLHPVKKIDFFLWSSSAV